MVQRSQQSVVQTLQGFIVISLRAEKCLQSCCTKHLVVFSSNAAHVIWYQVQLFSKWLCYLSSSYPTALYSLKREERIIATLNFHSSSWAHNFLTRHWGSSGTGRDCCPGCGPDCSSHHSTGMGSGGPDLNITQSTLHKWKLTHHHHHLLV